MKAEFKEAKEMEEKDERRKKVKGVLKAKKRMDDDDKD